MSVQCTHVVSDECVPSSFFLKLFSVQIANGHAPSVILYNETHNARQRDVRWMWIFSEFVQSH